MLVYSKRGQVFIVDKSKYVTVKLGIQRSMVA